MKPIQIFLAICLFGNIVALKSNYAEAAVPLLVNTHNDTSHFAAQFSNTSISTVDLAFDDIKLPWTRYETNNFIVYTDVSEKDAKALINELELFAASLAQLVKMPAHATLPKLKVFNFADDKLFAHFGGPANVQGYYFKAIDGPVIAIGPELNGESFDLTTIYHEYVHYFTRAVSNAKQPVWYSEGLADFFSTLNIDGDIVRVGATPVSRFNTLKRQDLLDLANLFNMTEYDESNFINDRLYASSWLVTHFMMLSERNGFPNYTASMDKMLALQQQGIKGEEAFDKAFDISLSEFKSQLSEYARKRSLNGVSISKPSINISITSKEIPQQKIVTLLSIVGRYHPPLFSQLLSLGMEQNDPLAYALIGELLSRETLTLELAQPLLELLAIMDITQPLTHDFIGQTYINMLDLKAKERNTKDKQQMKKWMQLAYTHFALGHELAPSELNLKGLTRLAWQQKDREAALLYANALYQLQNTDIETNYFVGEFMLRANNEAFAKFLLQNVINWSDAHTSLSDKAKSLLARIE